jgi:hypothetical protein
VLKHITKWELCSTKDHYKMTEPHTYTQKIRNQQQRCARVSMAQRLLSQTGPTPLSDAALTRHGLRKKFYDRVILGRNLYLPASPFWIFIHGVRRSFNHLLPLHLLLYRDQIKAETIWHLENAATPSLRLTDILALFVALSAAPPDLRLRPWAKNNLPRCFRTSSFGDFYSPCLQISRCPNS